MFIIDTDKCWKCATEQSSDSYCTVLRNKAQGNGRYSRFVRKSTEKLILKAAGNQWSDNFTTDFHV